MLRRRARIGAALGLFLLFTLPGLLPAQDDVPEVVKTLLDEGDRHRQAGRTDQAIVSYEEARHLAPSVVRTYVSLGALYHAQGDMGQALEVFTAGLEHDPEQPNLLFNAAVISMQLSRLEPALDYVDRAIAKDKREVNLHSLRSAVLRELGRLEEALGAQQAAARLDPGNAQVHYRLGNLYFELDRKGEAIDAYRKATKKDKNYLRAWYNLGAALFDMERFDEALEAYEVALKPVDKAFADGTGVDPANARAYLNLGAIHFRKQDWRAALDAYGKALRLDPEQSGAYYNQGYIHYQQRRFDAAAEAYQRALAIDPELPLACFHLGDIFYRRGQPAEALPMLERAIGKLDAGDELQARLVLGRSHHALGQTAAAKQAFSAVIAGDPNQMDALVALGRILRDEGDTERARGLLERARALDPDHGGVSLELAGLARMDGDRTREKALYEDLLRRSGTATEMWPVRVNLARVLVEEGARTAARETFAPVVERLAEIRQGGLDERDAQVLVTVYGLLLASEGRLDEARRSLQSVAGNGGATFAPAHDGVAVLEALEGRVDAAAENLERGLKQHLGQAFENDARANLGQVLWLTGRHQEARDHLSRAVRSFPDNVALNVALGEIAFTEGRLSGAVAALQKAMSQCGRGSPATEAGATRELRVVLGPAASPALCQRAEKSLGTALVAAAFADLEGGRATSAARTKAERALDLPLGGRERAVAYLVRGTAQLVAGADRGARTDLTRALEDLPESLRPLARNNLGVARFRLGEIDEARGQFESAGGSTEATLNLAILLDDHAGDNAGALKLYEAYLARGGRRRGEVAAWVERLKKVYE